MKSPRKVSPCSGPRRQRAVCGAGEGPLCGHLPLAPDQQASGCLLAGEVSCSYSSVTQLPLASDTGARRTVPGPSPHGGGSTGLRPRVGRRFFPRSPQPAAREQGQGHLLPLCRESTYKGLLPSTAHTGRRLLASAEHSWPLGEHLLPVSQHGPAVRGHAVLTSSSL